MPYNFNFVSWNYRGGLSFARKCRFIRSLVLNQNLSLLGLIETKKEHFDDFSVRILWPNLDFEFCFVPSVGASGGLLCIWNPIMISPTCTFLANRWISLDFIWSSFNIRFFLVYASNISRDRALLWDELLPEFTSDAHCIIAGDFNEILTPSERLNCSSIMRSKLDRCFLSPDFFTLWPRMQLKALPRSFSDHVPILFNSDLIVDWRPKPFKSINSWWSHKDFYDFVSNTWSSIENRLPLADFVIKLRELRNAIKT
ncbi:uncharacterized protein LOC126687951 [Mercurialis annua]|uniref:uncharacterized protein LOC126687951 n=1 Tax=Mercurialis annua TaxID=3986 RepID=UPI00215E4EB1|nr:uncharacterized protein LOC126687951 [Mercurialis annua]